LWHSDATGASASDMRVEPVTVRIGVNVATDADWKDTESQTAQRSHAVFCARRMRIQISGSISLAQASAPLIELPFLKLRNDAHSAR
jgi:hypothetical protein